MAQSGKGRLNYRCPSCFLRDLDIDMFYDQEKEEYYCMRCQYHSSEAEILRWNEIIRLRHGAMAKRLDEDECY